MEKQKKRKRVKKYPYHHTFRCTEDTQAMLKYLMESTLYSKSELIRECIKYYFDSPYNQGWIFSILDNFNTIIWGLMRMKEDDNIHILVLSAETEYQLKLLNENLKDIKTTLESIDKNFYQLVYDIINFK